MGIRWNARYCVLLAALALGAMAGPASAKPEPSFKPTKFYTGTVTGYETSWVYPLERPDLRTSSMDRWTVSGLTLKRASTKLIRNQRQFTYKVADGTVTWSHENAFTCLISGYPPTPTSVSFTDTFSLKGEDWNDEYRLEERITFYGPTTGRFKNRLYVDGNFSSSYEKAVEPPCPGGEPGSLGLPTQLFPGIRVNKKPPIAKPGKTVRLRADRHLEAVNSYLDSQVVLTLRPVTKK